MLKKKQLDNKIQRALLHENEGLLLILPIGIKIEI